jgi:hypothetical protein
VKDAILKGGAESVSGFEGFHTILARPSGRGSFEIG